jgi:hypothetical protein
MISLINAINETIKESKWYDKICLIFNFYIVIPISVITVVFVVMLLISTVAATLSLTKGMYYSYDNPVLLTLPCLPTTSPIFSGSI